jgi:hypothetical protein
VKKEATNRRETAVALEIKPCWDPSGSVSLRLCEERRELTVSADGELLLYRLRDDRPERLGWVEHRRTGGHECWRRVPVSHVVCACLRERDAEQLVIALSLAAADRARRRGGAWHQAGNRLASQAHSSRQRSRVSTLPFQVLFRHLSDPRRERPLTPSLAAERIGYTARGRADTSRLLRRLGLAEQRHGTTGAARRQRSVGYRTGVELCRAVDIDPVELGL